MNLEIENTTNYYQQRLNDINFLKSKNINPYPHFYEITHSIQTLRNYDSKIKEGDHQENINIRTTGRVILKRNSGKKLVFYTLEDNAITIQLMTSFVHYNTDNELSSSPDRPRPR